MEFYEDKFYKLLFQKKKKKNIRLITYTFCRIA